MNDNDNDDGVNIDNDNNHNNNNDNDNSLFSQKLQIDGHVTYMETICYNSI